LGKDEHRVRAGWLSVQSAANSRNADFMVVASPALDISRLREGPLPEDGIGSGLYARTYGGEHKDGEISDSELQLYSMIHGRLGAVARG
jgi:hypothetical protein